MAFFKSSCRKSNELAMCPFSSSVLVTAMSCPGRQNVCMYVGRYVCMYLSILSIYLYIHIIFICIHHEYQPNTQCVSEVGLSRNGRVKAARRGTTFQTHIMWLTQCQPCQKSPRTIVGDALFHPFMVMKRTIAAINRWYKTSPTRIYCSCHKWMYIFCSSLWQL